MDFSSMSVPWPSTVLRFQTAECVAGLAIIQAPSSVPFRFQFYGTTVGSVTLPPFSEPTAPYPICANALSIAAFVAVSASAGGLLRAGAVEGGAGAQTEGGGGGGRGGR